MRRRLVLGFALLSSACAHTASSAPATADEMAVQSPPAAYDQQHAAADPERGLYEIILQLARDPAAQAKLAPTARVVFHGEETTDEPLKDAYSELSWVREANPPLITGNQPDSAAEEVVVRCVAAELRCSIEQPGGETIFRFAQVENGAERRLVLSTIESEEP